jgi:DNA-binding transcriptional LysR family regulator
MNLLASLRYLVALQEHRHFGRAAQACHITQPALSNALRALEGEFGAVIVKRGRTFAGFTPEGERVLQSARLMLHERELLQQDLASVAGRPQGRLVIGVVPAAVPVAARFAAQLQALHPGITPTVRSMSSPEIEAGLDDLILDMGLGYTDRMGAGGAKLDQVPQYDERYWLVRRAPHCACGRWVVIGRHHQLGRRSEGAAVPADARDAQPHHRGRRLCRRGRSGDARPWRPIPS